MSELYTHKDLAVHAGVNVDLVMRWGKEGRLTRRLIAYGPEALERVIAERDRDDRTKLTREQVAEILQLVADRDSTYAKIADQFGVSESYISYLVNGKRRLKA